MVPVFITAMRITKRRAELFTSLRAERASSFGYFRRIRAPRA